MIRKLRAGQMPPPGAGGPTRRCSTAWPACSRRRPTRARRSSRRAGARFQRLNRAEYARSVHDLLALDVNAGDYLPLDAKSANFDNIADAQLLSPTLMQAYLTAAAEISRLARGRRRGDGARSRPTPCRAGPRSASRWRARRTARAAACRVAHTFPADGDYRFRVSFYHETTGALYGNGRAALHTAEAPEQVEISDRRRARRPCSTSTAG